MALPDPHETRRVGQRVEGLQRGVRVSLARVGDREGDFVAGGPDAVVQERAAGRLPTGEALDLLAGAGAGAKREAGGALAALASQERALEQRAVLGQALVG